MVRLDAYRANGPINTPAAPAKPGVQAGKTEGKSGFAEVLVDSIKDASAAEAQAEKVSAEMVAGKADIHEAMIAQEKAGIALRFAVTLKNRAVEAYREIMNTQI
jgi:flagellar hook-basal body complex protein FliE